MKVAQSLLLLLPFRKNICENSDCIHFKACCYIYKQKQWWFGFLEAHFAVYLQREKRYRTRSTFQRDVLNSTTRKSFPSATIPLNAEMKNFQACDFGAKGVSSSSHIYSLYPSRHMWRVYSCLRKAWKRPKFVFTDKYILINESHLHINLYLYINDFGVHKSPRIGKYSISSKQKCIWKTSKQEI